MSEKQKKTWFTFSLTPKERAAFETKFQASTCRSRNEYFRCLLLSQPVRIKHRNISIDDYIKEMLAFKKELLALLKDPGHPDNKALHEKLDAILVYVEKQYRLWSHT
jgi:hypothetical protein